MLFRLAPALALLLLTGCTTTSDFSRGMAEPLKVLNQAASIADLADTDVLKAHALGLSGMRVAMSESVCVKWVGPSAAQSSLALFADGFDIVQKVAEKPSDTSYAGYIRKFRENSENGAPVDVKAEREKAKQKENEQVDRCKQLFQADSTSSTSLAPLSTGPAALAEVVGITLGIDKMFKELLAMAEAAQREKAVRATVAALIPQMRDAKASLSIAPTAAIGPIVRFREDAAKAALDMNNSTVGATVTIRRWFVAQQILAQWTYLQSCREGKRTNCLGEPDVIRALNRFAENVKLYRALSRIDAVKVLSALDSAIKAAEASLETGKNAANWIDALVALADSVSSISDAYAAYDLAKD